MVAFGPLSAKSIAIWPAAMFGITAGAKNGLIRPPFENDSAAW